ncbi:UDP-glucose 6-dehydrogenase Ugd [Clostridium aceticum]|uniref:UDP-glucose 6-dehydrogenase Ugd n=1 Tax=Clostridium aceticum TaxID=84022 RepID=A0A0D8ICS0_9CLOT|nr:nucleotide sugar dehydrogenase [Clostridium aceticum]AKL95218.1 UDP-glucose 6-dehydrogenase Ugd [Clostridium aceticum]KJF28083.1 UDP-N-acetyl-D-glucosamine dehydrogenase [Clostridium aceticum]
MSLKNKIINKEAIVGIVGLGYVGLPLAVSIAVSGYKVIGIEVDEEKVAKLLKGVSYIKDVSDESIEKEVRKGSLLGTSDYKKMSQTDVIIICVPTPLKDNTPDVSYIYQTVKNIKQYAKKPSLIILESTSYPGTTEEVIMKELEGDGWILGKDFNLCFSPERVDPGNELFNLKNTPKIVGGISQQCTELAGLLYEKVANEVFFVSSAKTAEMVKLLENTFRSINIAFINEMALMCEKMELNIWEVLEAASTKPFGFMTFYPGPGIGGHCIPIDPNYLEWKAQTFNFSSRFIRLATEINESMPEYIVSTIGEILKTESKSLEGSKVLIVGVAYKKDIDDIRESPAFKIRNMLVNNKATVDYHDPYVKEIIIDNKKIYSIELNEENLKQYDCAVIITNHSTIDYRLLIENTKIIYDTRNAIREKNERVFSLGGVKHRYESKNKW